MNEFPFKIVGFDLDGTLLDTHGDLAVAVNYVLESIDRPSLPSADVRKMVGGGARIMLERALLQTGGLLPEDQLKALHQNLIAYYTENISAYSKLYPGGQAMLDGLQGRGVKLAVVTNKLERLAIRLLTDLGLDGYFYTIIGGDTLGAGRSKPAPDLLYEMLRRGGGLSAAFVGDTTFDTCAAKAAGLPCIAVDFGYNDVPVSELGGAALISHFDQLIPALENIEKH